MLINKSLLRKLYYLFLMPFGLLGVFIIRLLRSFLLIRLGNFESSRIGHFAGNTELYLCKRDARIFGRRTYDIFYYTMPACNYQLKKMWDRTLRVSRFFRFMYLVDYINRRLPGHKKHIIPLGDHDGVYDYYAYIPAHLSFTKEEEGQGYLELQRLGIPQGTPFVCFHSRDPAYLSTVNPSVNWSYHSYRDTNIKNYIPAMQTLAQRSYFAIRMGNMVKEPLNITNSMIIDYATKFRTDFLDIYLSAKCQFFVGCGSGIDEVPKIFRRPVVYVSFIPLEGLPAWSSLRLFIPKKLWSKKYNRFLTFGEILQSGIGRSYFEEEYEKNGIEIIENTPEEITAVTLEMEERIKGVWQPAEKDEELQRRFLSLFQSTKLHGRINTRIGAEFLRKNQELLC